MLTFAENIAFLIGRDSKLLNGSLSVSIESILRINTKVAIPRQFRLTDIADNSAEADTIGKTCKLEAPQCLLAGEQGYNLETHHSLRAPCLMAHHITAHAVFIACFAIVGLVNIYTIDMERNVAAAQLLIYSKDGAVAGLNAPVSMTAIESPSVAVVTVNTNKSPSFWTIGLCHRHQRQQQQ